MKKIFLYFFIIFFFSCSENKITSEKIPSYILPKEKMQEILKDIHLAEATIDQASISPDSVKIIMQTLYGEVFAKYKIADKQFFTSYQFYFSHPTLIENMYEIIIEDLTKMESEIKRK